jgi:hypothetical protein
LDTSTAGRDRSKKGKKKNNNRPGERKTEYKILPPKLLSAMKKILNRRMKILTL